MRLVLVRHAEAEESARGRCYGSLDVGLSANGCAQCEQLAAALAGEPIAAVVSSPRVRATATAAAIARPHGLEATVDPNLRELDFGELEGRSYDEIAASLPELYAEWMTRPTRVRFPGGRATAIFAFGHAPRSRLFEPGIAPARSLRSPTVGSCEPS